MSFNYKMDHFLSGLDSQSPWYSPKAFQSHEFSVGLNSFQLIPISGSAVPQCSSEREMVSIGTSGMLPSSSLTSSTNSPLLAEVKLEMGEERIETDGQQPSQSTKPPGKRSKGRKWDTRKACNICGKVLSRGDKLKNHIRIHTNNFPYHCDTCGHGFLRAEGLRVHTRIHTGERPFVCIICGKSYTRKDKLTRHAIVHTGERPFVCQHCGKSFTRKDKMQRHELIHKVEKPWTCVPCNVEFVRQEGFNAHMERKHPERLPYTLIPHQQRLLQKTLAGDYSFSDRPTLVPPSSSIVMTPSTSSHALDHMPKNNSSDSKSFPNITPSVSSSPMSSGGPP